MIDDIAEILHPGVGPGRISHVVALANEKTGPAL
jgi:hypothetical protein